MGLPRPLAPALSNGLLTLRFPHFKLEPDVTLRLEASEDLLTWESLPTAPVAEGGNVEILQAAVPVAERPQRYFRLRARFRDAARQPGMADSPWSGPTR